uniref:Plastocyanin-like domain-containing protein n=1 Tax=Panagrolaimus sp. JU765 TaxID=591449 RepID=A0AC34Q079_9BILA
MTMTRPLEFGKAAVLDFDVDSQSWFERDSNQLLPCGKTDVFLNSTVPLEQVERALAGLVQLDGLHHRMIMINGKTPGDPIVVPYGSEVVMKVKNRLNTEGFTVHVHGLDKRGLWYTDGVAHIQQCPIPVNSDYTYRFIADAYGTHWYHGHLGSDRAEGLLGGFIVKDKNHTVPDPQNPKKRLHIKRDYYAMLQDWGIPEPAEQHYNLHDG